MKTMLWTFFCTSADLVYSSFIQTLDIGVLGVPTWEPRIFYLKVCMVWTVHLLARYKRASFHRWAWNENASELGTGNGWIWKTIWYKKHPFSTGNGKKEDNTSTIQYDNHCFLTGNGKNTRYSGIKKTQYDMIWRNSNWEKWKHTGTPKTIILINVFPNVTEWHFWSKFDISLHPYTWFAKKWGSMSNTKKICI